MRLVKKVLKQSFPNIGSEMSASSGELNLLVGLTTAPLQTGNLSASGGIASLDTNRKLPHDFFQDVYMREDVAEDVSATYTFSTQLVAADARIEKLNASATANFDGPVSSRVAVLTGATMDLATAQSFTKGVSATFSLAFTNAITSKATDFYVRFSAAATGAFLKLPNTIQLKNGGNPPSFTVNKNYVLVAFSDDGATYRGAFLSGFDA